MVLAHLCPPPLFHAPPFPNQPHATMLLRNRSRRALTRFVSALFSDVPAVLARTSFVSDGITRTVTPPTPGEGADSRRAAHTFTYVL